ncbi:MAG: hypothetical protein H0V81_09960, partial [Solirubrobacterales bacterium]|nr:hypothetical protein [Solirubrobacterales bacterium]
MSTLARAVFATLVVATFGAFFAAQRLKNEPTAVQGFGRTPIFSPNGDGRREQAKLSFLLKTADTVDVDVVTTDGDVVRSLAKDRALPAFRKLALFWDGTTDDGKPAPDGVYRARITLRDEGRAITVPKSFRKDTTPPRPRVTSVGPSSAPTAELLPRKDGEPATVNFQASGRRPKVTIWRTDTVIPERVTSSGTTLRDDATSWAWDGTADGEKVPSGTYLAVVQSRDGAGNIGFSVPFENRVPKLEFGRRLPGRGGISVRYLTVQPPSTPIIAGEKADVFIDARGERWRYTLRRIGEPKIIRRSQDAGTGPRLPLRAPNATGTYLLEVRTATRSTRAPIIVQQNIPVGRVLVVLPWITWQGRNPIDDDGDGRPNTLEAGLGVRAERVFAGDGLPVDFAIREAPVLAFLDRTRRDYDLTTDLALARGTGPKLDEFQGALIPGDARWLPPKVGAQLRRFARDGGTVVSLGTESLQRQVELSPRGKRLIKPTSPTEADLFGAVLQPVRRGRTELTVAQDEIGLFEGDEGVFPDVDAYEATARLDG